MKKQVHLAMKGFVQASVIDANGREVQRLPVQPNLILDQGLDAIADIPIADIFKVAVKGEGNDPTVETVSSSTYKYDVSDSSVNRFAGTRDFTNADIGKQIQFTGSGTVTYYPRIVSVSSATKVIVEPAHTVSLTTARTIKLYAVDQVGLEDEPDINAISGGANFTKAEGDDEVENLDGPFTADDVGRAIYFVAEEKRWMIATFVDADHVTVTIPDGDDIAIASDDAFIFEVRDEENRLPLHRTKTYSVAAGDNSTITAGATRTLKRSFIFAPELELLEDVADTNTYSRSSNIIARTAGTRNFTADDVGKILKWDDDGTETKITDYTDATHVKVLNTGAKTDQTIKLYGYHTYEEVGFSHLDLPGDNLNIRIMLSSPVKVLGPTPLQPSQRLKLVYSFQITVSPSTVTTTTLDGIISDPAGADKMSTSKDGKHAIEGFATSTIEASGDTNIDFALLEPCFEGHLGLSTDTTVLDPLGSTIRQAAVQSTPFVAAAYSPGDYEKNFVGTFDINDGIANNWRSMMLIEDETKAAIYTYLFDTNQKKTANRIFSMTLTKTWNQAFA